MIHRCMVVVVKRPKDNHFWVQLKGTHTHLGVLMQGQKNDRKAWTWRELGFNTKPQQAKSKEEAVARLLLRLNGDDRG